MSLPWQLEDELKKLGVLPASKVPAHAPVSRPVVKEKYEAWKPENDGDDPPF